MFGPIVIVILAIIFLILFFSFVPLGLWISARASGVKIGIFQLVGMRVRKVIPARIVNPTTWQLIWQTLYTKDCKFFKQNR